MSPLVQVVNLEVEVRGQVGRAHLGCNIHSDNFAPWVGVRNFDRPGCRAEPTVEDAPQVRYRIGEDESLVEKDVENVMEKLKALCFFLSSA